MSSLKRWLKKRGITQKDLAEEWRVDDGTLSTYIRGTASMPPEIQARFEKMTFKGPWPQEEAQHGVVPPESHQNLPTHIQQYVDAKAAKAMMDTSMKDAPGDLQRAQTLLDEMVFKGRPWKDHLKLEMAENVREEMMGLRMMGYSGYALDKAIRDRIRLWLQLSSEPGKDA